MKPNRRQFLKTASAIPFILPSGLWAADVKPNDKINVGCIGMGKQMEALMRTFAGNNKAKVVAVCDVDTTRREAAKKELDTRYENTDCASYNDYRELIARKDIDAVCIATPDHWHAIPMVAAMKAGKDVYCEKPLTHNINEAIEVMEVTEKTGRVLQTGSMQRSSSEFRVASELVRNGVIGEIKTIDCGFGGPASPCNLPEEAAEPGLDWDMWVGPAPMRPYNSVLSPRGVCKHYPRWRNYSEFGGGGVCDWGAHHLDISHWAMGMDGSGPSKVTLAEKDGDGKNAVLTYGDGILLTHKTSLSGSRFFGTEGEIFVGRGRFELKIGGKVVAKFLKGDKGTSVQAEVQKAERAYLKNAKIKLYKSKNQIWDFLDCVKSREKPICNAEVGARTAIGCHLINQVYYNKQSIQWNPKKLKFVGGTGDPAWLTRQYRSPWTM